MARNCLILCQTSEQKETCMSQTDAVNNLFYKNWPCLDSIGNLYIMDSGNSRIAVANGSTVFGVSGGSGTGLGQFNSPTNISISERGIYVEDGGNSRIECFNPLPSGVYTFTNTDLRFAFSPGFSPTSISARDSLTNEMFYILRQSDNTVKLYQIAPENPLPVWNSMTNRIFAADVSGAALNFSIVSANQYQQAFLSSGTANAISAIGQIGQLMPVSIRNDTAEYYFEQTVAGQTVTFPVKFVKENGIWKILEF